MISSISNDIPLQLYHLVDGAVRCQQAKPPKNLQAYIYYYWWLDVAPGDTTLEVIPDNAIDLVMCPGIANFSILYLPASEKFTIPLSGPVTYIGISFRAAVTSEFFKVDVDDLKSCMAGEDTTEKLLIHELVNGVQNIKKPDQLAGVLDELVTSRLFEQCNISPTTASTTTASQAALRLDIDKTLAAMQASVGTRGMQSVADQFGLSDRQFRRVMGSLFGYGPKKVQRVMRLQAALKEIFLADALQNEDGFYDEAHKIKEIRALTGFTPGQIRKMSEIYNSMD